MAPSPSADPIPPADAEVLLDVAEATIVGALDGSTTAPPSVDALSPPLRSHQGAFVTLTLGGELNGCIGRLAADEPLVHAVARLARSAAFDDPRLPPLRATDLAELEIEVSVLSERTAIDVVDRRGLAAALRPTVDGLVVAAGRHQGVFLPGVWRQLPDPEEFLDRLWAKVGWRPRTWPVGLRAERFTTQVFHRARSRS